MPHFAFESLDPRVPFARRPDGTLVLLLLLLTACPEAPPAGLGPAFAYVSGGHEIRVEWEDGTRTRIADGQFPSWLPGGETLIYEREGHLFRVSRHTGWVEQPIDTGSTRASVPSVSPDGRWIAFEGWPNGLFPMRIHRIAIDGGPPEMLTEDAGLLLHTEPVFSADGRTIYFTNAGELEELDLETKQRTLLGLDNIVGRVAVSSDGSIAFARAVDTESVQVFVRDPRGNERAIASVSGSEPAFSPCGLALTTRRSERTAIELVDPEMIVLVDEEQSATSVAFARCP